MLSSCCPVLVKTVPERSNPLVGYRIDPFETCSYDTGHWPIERGSILPKLDIRATSTRTFIVYPVILGALQLLTHRKIRPQFAPLLVWGYLEFKLSGRYRTRLGGGGPGMSKPPERIVKTGIFRYTRNPMYLGHMIFMAGLALMTSSPLAYILFGFHLPWFNDRAKEDEAQLQRLFGEEYEQYRRSVARWVPFVHKLG